MNRPEDPAFDLRSALIARHDRERRVRRWWTVVGVLAAIGGALVIYFIFFF